MTSRKRERDDDATWRIDEAVEQLQSTLERDTQHKLRALDKVLALIDPSDEQYNVQRALVDGDAAFYITELLSDPSASVRAAEAVAAVCRHSAPSMARLAAGPLVGLDSSVERVSLNPCQSDFVDSGAVAALVPMVLGRAEAAREAAVEAVTALCSFHQEGKLAYLEGLVQALTQRQEVQALEVVDALIDGMECGGEQASTQLGLVQQPLLAELRAGHGRPCSQAAVSLVGTLCEKRPQTAAELREGGAVASVAQHLLHSSQEVQDIAARALWLLVKDERSCLAAEGNLLGCDAAKLAAVLAELVEVADAEEVRARDGFGGADSSGEEEQCTNNGGPPTPTAADICHADEATELLKALAAAHPAVARLVQDRAVPLVRASSQRCSIM